MARLRPLLWLISLALALALGGWSGPSSASTLDTAADLLAQLSPQQRVGQLLLVTFRGPALPADSWVYELVRSGLISGVQLSAGNGNFGTAADGSATVAPLIASLQAAALGDLTAPTPTAETPPEGSAVHDPAPRLPLIVAVRHTGDGAPWASVAGAYPDTPSQMSLGATWDPGLARQVGAALGRSLEQMGFNLLLGPSLDILGDPRLGGPEDLGVRSFGGDPYWVGLLGRAFIEGVHAGTGSRVGVVVTHFPGLGASDRPAAQEIATVRRTLDQLKGFELQPFYSVASGTAGAAAGVADGMLITHLRYQGLQGNIRDTTRPVSLDAEAFGQLMQTEPLAGWRAGGGLVVSDSLGSAAIRRFIDPAGVTFNAPLVARDAFIAGSDLLLLDSFRASTDPDEATTIRATVRTFVQRYADDPLFAQRVDEAALRVLQLKLRLYGGSFTAESLQHETSIRDALAPTDDLEREVARGAATLISPSLADLRVRLGEGPRIDDRLVFFTDLRRAVACNGCLAEPGVAIDALQSVIQSLYGGGNGSAGQIRGWNLASFSTGDLAAYLGDKPPNDPANPIHRAEDVEAALRSANWLVFVVERARPTEFGSGALQMLLRSHPELLVGKKIVVFAMDVPYDLDATDISKVDALFALYSRGPGFVDMAARLLFGELQASGSSPVGVPSIGYDLIEVLSPDPEQVIALSVALEGRQESTPGPEGFRVNDAIRVTTGVIVDANGNTVPDGTLVEFVLGYPGELPSSIEQPTEDGVASTGLTLGRLGLLSITARSDQARASSVVQLNVQENIPAFVTVIAPTPVPSLTAPPPVGIATPPASTPEPEGVGARHAPPLGPGSLVIGVVAALLSAGAGYGFGRRRSDEDGARRAALLALVAGLAAYNYLAWQLPGSEFLLDRLGAWGVALGTLTGGVLGTCGWWLSRSRASRAARD